MAVNETGNLSRSLREGLTDGAVKKAYPDRGGAVEPDAHNRFDLQDQYGYAVSEGANMDAADRLHDGKIIGEADQDTTFTWFDTDVHQESSAPLPSGVTL